jgi:hypothetical protein
MVWLQGSNLRDCLLMRLIDLKALSLAEGDALLARMIAAGYRSPVTSLQELL